MSNHLGNVLVTISDKKIAVQNGTTGTIAYYNADVVTANDYYPFGMNMPGRKYSQPNTNYRYGFNGKENDKDISEGGQDYGMRISDNRLGRFLSVDPITKEYPELTPYQFASNRPIDGIDQDGLEYYPAGRRGSNQLATDATAVVHYQANPVLLSKQVEQAPARSRMATAKAMDIIVRQKAQQQGPAMRQYREPDIYQKAKNEAKQKAYDATVIPDNHWTKNKPLNSASDRLVQPMVEMAIGDGAGRLIFKGLGYVFNKAITQEASTLATTWQKNAELGVDTWRNITLNEGSYVVGGLPGQSNFYTTISGLNRSGLNKSAFWDGLQVPPSTKGLGLRPQVGIYEVPGNTSAAFGTTYANPTLGAGGLPQIFIPDYSKLKLITTLPLKTP